MLVGTHVLPLLHLASRMPAPPRPGGADDAERWDRPPSPRLRGGVEINKKIFLALVKTSVGREHAAGGAKRKN